jgi:hypothetical protein
MQRTAAGKLATHQRLLEVERLLSDITAALHLTPVRDLPCASSVTINIHRQASTLKAGLKASLKAGLQE